MNKKVFLSFLLLGAVVLIGAGCGGQKATEEGLTTGPDGEEEVSVSEVLDKAQNLKGYSFEVKVTSSEQGTMTSKMWIEGANMRWEGNVEGEQVVYIIGDEGKTAYVYMPSQNMAIEQNLSETKGAIGDAPHEEASMIAQLGLETSETKTWDGKNCLVVKVVSETGDETKWWIWKEYGIPVKTEITSHAGEVIVTELYNLEVGDIDDSVFELPEGVQIMQYPSF